MDLSKFATQIHSTGFPLEHRIAVALRNAGWGVIANKYYVDDLEQSVREVDLVAYRMNIVNKVSICTTLIISCKKSDKNVWALLSRPVRGADPNTDPEPCHAWSNDIPLIYMMSQSGWASAYYKRAREASIPTIMNPPARDIFAFQEMDRDTGRPHNDKAIFGAVTSLMKAQSYELEVLPKRRKEPSLYQFNLVNIVDSDLVCLDFSESSTVVTPVTVDAELYLARYIIKKSQMFARIQFVTAPNFDRMIPEYRVLHEANCAIFGDMKDAFYAGIMQEPERWKLLFEQFRATINTAWLVAQYRSSKVTAFSNITGFNHSADRLVIETDGTPNYPAINADRQLKLATTDALKSVYRYAGDFEFAEETIPF